MCPLDGGTGHTCCLPPIQEACLHRDMILVWKKGAQPHADYHLRDTLGTLLTAWDVCLGPGDGGGGAELPPQQGTDPQSGGASAGNSTAQEVVPLTLEAYHAQHIDGHVPSLVVLVDKVGHALRGAARVGPSAQACQHSSCLVPVAAGMLSAPHHLPTYLNCCCAQDAHLATRATHMYGRRSSDYELLGHDFYNACTNMVRLVTLV